MTACVGSTRDWIQVHKTNSYELALQCMSSFVEQGWKVMVPIFVTQVEMIELQEEMVVPNPVEWTFVMFKL